MISVEINVPEIRTGLDEPIRKSLRESVLLVRRDASKLAPFRSGTLRRSIVEKVYSDRGTVGTNVIYARIHEFGGTITPKNKKYLRFKIKGKWVTTSKVVIKKKPYLRPALEQNKDAITKIFARNISEYLGRK